VWWHHRDSTVTVLDADGSVRGRIEVPYEVSRALVDADERIWVFLSGAGGGDMVFDRDLDLVMKVRENHVQDARGDYLLTGSRDEHDLWLFRLLRRRSGG